MILQQPLIAMSRPMRVRGLAAGLTLLAMASCPAGAFAMSFAEALTAAYVNDAPFRAAGFDTRCTSRRAMRAAQLLPAVGLTANESTSRFAPLPERAEPGGPRAAGLQAPQVSLNMRMPIFNYEAFSGYRQAQAQSEVAEAVFRSQG